MREMEREWEKYTYIKWKMLRPGEREKDRETERDIQKNNDWIIFHLKSIRYMQTWQNKNKETLVQELIVLLYQRVRWHVSSWTLEPNITGSRVLPIAVYDCMWFTLTNNFTDEYMLKKGSKTIYISRFFWPKMEVFEYFIKFLPT